MRTETVTFLKKHAADLPVKDSPMTITQNGTPAYVIESAKDYEDRQETMALLKLLALSAQDKQQGRVLSQDELMARIQKRKDALSL
jgi:PHD/YefM family antitoxin component YafN of YafNO toxin-antitoxin module